VKDLEKKTVSYRFLKVGNTSGDYLDETGTRQACQNKWGGKTGGTPMRVFTEKGYISHKRGKNLIDVKTFGADESCGPPPV
jgi:hypothetical protein